MRIHTPDWVKQAIFYEIFPDRFAIGKTAGSGLVRSSELECWDAKPTVEGYKGGNLSGITSRLSYLSDLGINAIYLTPIFQSPSNHRYHTHDFYKVDPLLGGEEAFDDLLNAAQKRDIKIVLDGVFNHVGRSFLMFSDILEHGATSPYLNWFKIERWPISPYDKSFPANYDCWEGMRALPTLNHDNPYVREFIMEVGEYWIRRGIDGWRLDVPYCIDTPGFWQEFRQRIKAINSEAYLVGEIIQDASKWLDGKQFDGVTNYPFRLPTVFFAAGPYVNQTHVDKCNVERLQPLPLDATRYASIIERLVESYPWEIQLTQLNVLGTHDTARVITIVGDDRDSLKLATLLQMTFPGAPCIYYGDEIGLHGGGDPDCRRGFPTEGDWDKDMLSFYRNLISLRRSYVTLQQGSYRILYACSFVYVFCRILGDRWTIVAINAGLESTNVEIGRAARDKELSFFNSENNWRILFSTENIDLAGTRINPVLELPARSGCILG
jgi:glycosidase